MATTTTVNDQNGHKDAHHADAHLACPKHKHRDEFEHLETLEHLGLVRDLEETLTPIDMLFNAQEAASKSKGEPRHYL